MLTGYIWYRSAQPLNQPLAFSGPTSIAINQQGEVHLYSALLDRIQIFNADGQFQRSIRTGNKAGKRGLNLCGGSEHPILLEDRASDTIYDVQKAELTYPKDRDTQEFCRKSRNRSVAVWNARLYQIQDWPQRLVMRQRGHIDRIIIPGSWWATIAGKSIFFLGISSAILIVTMLVGLFFKLRHDAVK